VTVEESWLCARLTVAPEETEIAANWLLEQGCEGVQVEDLTILFDESEDATIVPRDEATVTGYLRGAEAEAEALRVVEKPFQGQLAVEPVASQDWSTQWRENFPPLEIGPFVVVPTWEEIPEISGKTVLRLDPGLAFGTGQHPTTSLCLELLAENVQPGLRVLDVGCGSGILSLAAAKLGAEVTGSDLDPWCVQATRENAELNGVQVDVQERADLDWVQEPFPLVIANLMSDLLIRLAPELARVTEPGGKLIVSGISAPRAGDVETALQGAGFETRRSEIRDGEVRGEGPEGWTERWAAFVFERRN
jgi:ribosomal protein L11 methyltransferase